MTEEEGLEAKTFFKKRNPTVINCLRALVEQVNCLKNDSELNAASQHLMKSNSKEPPQIVSNRAILKIQSNDQLDTEYSDANTSRRFSEAQNNYGTLQKESNRDPVNLVINQEY